MTNTRKKEILITFLKNTALLGAVLVLELVLYFTLGVNCPTKLFMSIDCPFCGMTRAHLAALTLDFKSAFAYHPFFFLGIPYLVLIVNENLFRGRFKKPYWAAMWIMTALFILRFILQFI